MSKLAGQPGTNKQLSTNSCVQLTSLATAVKFWPVVTVYGNVVCISDNGTIYKKMPKDTEGRKEWRTFRCRSYQEAELGIYNSVIEHLAVVHEALGSLLSAGITANAMHAIPKVCLRLLTLSSRFCQQVQMLHCTLRATQQAYCSLTAGRKNFLQYLSQLCEKHKTNPIGVVELISEAMILFCLNKDIP